MGRDRDRVLSGLQTCATSAARVVLLDDPAHDVRTGKGKFAGNTIAAMKSSRLRPQVLSQMHLPCSRVRFLRGGKQSELHGFLGGSKCIVHAAIERM